MIDREKQMIQTIYKEIEYYEEKIRKTIGKEQYEHYQNLKIIQSNIEYDEEEKESDIDRLIDFLSLEVTNAILHFFAFFGVLLTLGLIASASMGV